ncbi:hypothetical protein [Aestuariibacter sp. A3R04]|uniref:hypothetical protein n=1 Tax=Aestuariibacter sp. A3R04 TaxID=2841571 RepID=UPI001C099381|nr:hypothetical protein [Aestuariibacter sp. A3R04]MBU3020242.1 hypothetical protein [Aestuariibacter sp. A3R04]
MKNLIIPACLLASAAPFNAFAEVNLSGFGSVVGGISTESDAIVRGYEDSVEIKQGSFFALQAYSDLSDGLSATVQVRARGLDDWEPEFTWAYLSYEVDTNWRIQVGRQRIPIYLYSDYLDVSYAYHWIAPPSEVYKATFDSIDGISSIHDFSVGDAMVNLRAYYGQEDYTNADGDELELDDVFSVVASVNYGWWTFRTSYIQFDMTGNIGLGELVNAWKQTPYGSVGDDLAINEDRLTGFEVGVIFDNQDWLFLAEYIPSTLENSVIGDYEPWMVSVGKRFGEGKYMIHGTVGEDVVESATSVNGVPVGVDPALDALIATTEGVIDRNTYENMFYTVGLRWDFHDSAAFKAEYTHTDLAEGGDAGLFQVALVTVF